MPLSASANPHPRAVPQDVALAVASAVVDGGLVVKALLIAGLLLAGWGAARLADRVLPETGVAGHRRRHGGGVESLRRRTVAAGALEPAGGLRLSALGGRGRCATADRGPRRGAWAAMVFFVALAGLTPTGVLLAAVVALACVAARPGGRRIRCTVWVLAAAVVTAGRG